MKKHPFRNLPPEEKTAVLKEIARLRHEQGLTFPQIGGKLGMTEKGAASLYYQFIRQPEENAQDMAKRKAETNEIEALKAEIRRLRSQNAQLRVDLEDERLKAHAYDTMIDLAERIYHIPVRKNSGTKQ